MADFRDLLNESFLNLKKSGLRTYLTLLGIIIGILAITSLLSIGAGLSESVEREFEVLGTNSVVVSIGGFSMNSSSTLSLDDADLDYIKSVRGVTGIISEYFVQKPFRFGNELVNSSFAAIDDDGWSIYKSSSMIEIVDGDWINVNDFSGVMISESMANDKFRREISVGKLVYVDGLEYRVVGIFKMRGALASSAPGGDFVITNYKGFKRLIDNPVSVSVTVKTESASVSEDVKKDLDEYFIDKYGERAVTVQTSEEVLESISSILSIITIVLVGIGAISLVVGGVGIMNAMITSVLERTQEIGLYKALGARSNMILILILLESGLMGLIGGIIGVLLGYGISSLISIISNAAGFPIGAAINFEITFFALAFAVFVGMISGYYPAKRAADLDPVEALRYE